MTTCDDPWGADYARSIALAAERCRRPFAPFVYQTPGVAAAEADADTVALLGRLLAAIGRVRQGQCGAETVYRVLAECPAGERSRLLAALAITNPATAALLTAQLAAL